MNATDELRKLLEEWGVEWQSGTRYYVTHWSDCERHFTAVEQDSKLYVQYSVGPLTPTQAIAATLGADEYAIEHNVDGSYKCPICGCVVDYDIRGDDERIITMDDYVIPFNFCPKCGAKVVDK